MYFQELIDTDVDTDTAVDASITPPLSEKIDSGNSHLQDLAR